jgi:AcrR family transcriptional regulator
VRAADRQRAPLAARSGVGNAASKAKVGRPRSEKSCEAVIRATHDLLRETGGVGLSIEAIARRAEVGKPTIYRWWPSLADVVLEVLLRQADAGITVPAGKSLRETLRRFLRLSMKALAEGAGTHLRFLMAQAQTDEEFRRRFRENFTARRREALASVFQQSAERGRLGAEHDLEMLVDMIFGAMWYRLLTGHAPLDKRFADELTEASLALFQATACGQG